MPGIESEENVPQIFRELEARHEAEVDLEAVLHASLSELGRAAIDLGPGAVNRMVHILDHTSRTLVRFDEDDRSSGLHHTGSNEFKDYYKSKKEQEI